MGEVAGLWPRGTFDLTESLSCQGLKGTESGVRAPIISVNLECNPGSF